MSIHDVKVEPLIILGNVLALMQRWPWLRSCFVHKLSYSSLIQWRRQRGAEVPDAIDEFARRHPRRMELMNIFVDSS